MMELGETHVLHVLILRNTMHVFQLYLKVCFKKNNINI